LKEEIKGQRKELEIPGKKINLLGN